MLSWHFVTAAEYYGAGSRDAEKLYFLSDTHEIYKGDIPFTEAVIMVDDSTGGFNTALQAITNPARRKIYMSQTTMEGRIYDGTSWKTVIRAVDTAVTDSSSNLITSGAVATYVAQKIAEVTGGEGFVKNITYTPATATLAITGGEGEPNIQLSGLGVSLKYTAETGAIQLQDVTGAPVGSAINIDLERFVSAAAYDSAKKEIILAFTDVAKIDTGASYQYPDTMPASPTEGTACRATAEGEPKWYVYQSSAWTEIPEAETPLVIAVGDLVDTYTAANTDTIEMTVSTNQFSANVKLDSTKGENLIKSSSNGLYVAPVDLSTYMELVSGATENNIASFGTDGQVKDSGVKAGGATLVGTAGLLATEQAVQAAITALQNTLQSAIDGKIAKVASATANNVPTLTADGSIQDSGKAIGGATLNSAPNANTLATEAAVKAAIDTAKADCLVDSDKKTTIEASDTDDTIPTSQAVVEALSWVTTM